MNRIKQFVQQRQQATEPEKGQSIVLIALMMVAIIAFVGIAIDVGFIFARGSQLQSAVDSAALAGVVELSGWSPGGINNPTLEANARTVSAQFLNANNMPISVTASLNITNNVDVSTTPLGATQYAVTVTWPVETYFLQVIGFREPINLSRSATAAIFSLADIYASRRVEEGVVSTSNQGIFGPNSCTHMGDPFSPLVSQWEPEAYTYTYRIYIPPNYAHEVVRVELFDPDSINTSQNQASFFHSTNARIAGLPPTGTGVCTNNFARQTNPCLVPTGELGLVTGAPNLDLDQINPYWFVRIDENRRPPTTVGGGCGEPGSYTPAFNTQTRYTLSYFAQTPGSSPEKTHLVTYFGQTGDARDTAIYGGSPGDHRTDLRWVSPGTAVPFSTVDDPGVPVPATPGTINSFEVNLTTDVPHMVIDQNTGARYIYLDVQAMSGASENGFEVWAGPPDYVTTVPSNVNNRNVHILNNPGSHSSQGVTVYGLGNLPMNSNFGNVVDVPLMYVGPDMIGQTIQVGLFDTDSGAAPPLVFYFDSLAFTPSTNNLGYDPALTDWARSFHVSGQADPEGQTFDCVLGNCNNEWAYYNITVPGNTDDCNPASPTMADCTPFYGGRLIARYRAGFTDTYGLQIRLEGLPYLVK